MDGRDKEYLLISILMHAVLIAGLTVKVYFFPTERPEFIRSVRVDLVALPDKDPEEGPQGVEKPATETTKKPEPPKKKDEPVKLPPDKPTKSAKNEKKPESKKKDEPKDDSKATKDQQSDALKRLQALANLKKKMKDIKPAEGPEGKQYKGNQVSEGTSLTGVEQIQHDKYLAMLYEHVKKNWSISELISQENLKAFVLVKFDESGNLLEKRLVRSSGSQAFDKEAMQAIAASAPFPIPPENLVSYFKVRGIELRFPE